MKVLFISSGNNRLGISPIVKNQGESLIGRSIELDFFTIKGKGFFSYFKHMFKLRKKLINCSYDIIHAHYGLCGIISLISKRKEILIVSFMGDDILGSNKRDGSVSIVSSLMSKLNIWIAHYFYDAIIVKSPEMANKMGSSTSLFIIANGIDMEKFQPLLKEKCMKSLCWDNTEIHVLFPSDPKRLEKNFSLAKKAIMSFNTSYRINLHCTEDVSYNDMPIYLNASDIILTTSFHEGSPNVIKEAMACNRPIVSTNVGDVNWIFGNTEGCYITSYILKDVIAKISLAIEFSQKAHCTKGRDRIIQLGLDSGEVADKICGVYRHSYRT